MMKMFPLLEEDNSHIYAHLDNVLVHMIDNQEAAIFKSKQDFNRNKEKNLQYIVRIAVVIIVMYFCCMKCRHTRTIFKYCFPFLLISCIIHTSRHTDLFVEVTNVTKGNGIWAHFPSTGYFPSQIQLLRQI